MCFKLKTTRGWLASNLTLKHFCFLHFFWNFRAKNRFQNLLFTEDPQSYMSELRRKSDVCDRNFMPLKCCHAFTLALEILGVCGHESLHKKVYFTNTHWVMCECTQFGYVTFLNYVSPSTRLPFKPARHTPRFIFDKIANFAFLLLSWWIVNFLLL